MKHINEIRTGVGEGKEVKSQSLEEAGKYLVSTGMELPWMGWIFNDLSLPMLEALRCHIEKANKRTGCLCIVLSPPALK